VEKVETASLSHEPNVDPNGAFPWINAIPATPSPPQHNIIGKLTPAVFNEALRLLPSHKAPSPDNIPGVLIKYMPRDFHDAVFQLFQTMTITGITPPNWLHSNTILLYKKNDLLDLANYRPFALAFALYKLWTSCLNILA
jgi:hypothetical protein